jgi:inner membrane protein
MQNWLTAFGSWTWWIVAGVLFLLELAMPGVIFIWLALAAVAIGIIAFFTDFSWQIQLVLFAVLSIVFVLIAKPWFRKRQLAGSDRPNLNRRMHAFVGRSFVLDQPIADGRGKISIEGTWWDVRGSDQPKGQWVTVTGVEDMRLIVEPTAGKPI